MCGGQQTHQSKERPKQDYSLLEFRSHEVILKQKLVRKDAQKEERINVMFLKCDPLIEQQKGSMAKVRGRVGEKYLGSDTQQSPRFLQNIVRFFSGFSCIQLNMLSRDDMISFVF